MRESQRQTDIDRGEEEGRGRKQEGSKRKRDGGPGLSSRLHCHGMDDATTGFDCFVVDPGSGAPTAIVQKDWKGQID